MDMIQASRPSAEYDQPARNHKPRGQYKKVSPEVRLQRAKNALANGTISKSRFRARQHEIKCDMLESCVHDCEDLSEVWGIVMEMMVDADMKEEAQAYMLRTRREAARLAGIHERNLPEPT